MPINATLRARDAWRRIGRWPTSIQFVRQGEITDDAPPSDPTTLPAQTVRISRDNRPRTLRGESGEGTELHCVLYGVVGHPDAAVVDTDVQRGDTFQLDGDHFIVDHVKFVPGGLQAVCVLQAIGVAA
jgi:hypothetical protein